MLIEKKIIDQFSEEIKALTAIGLTRCQAIVYLSIINRKRAYAKTICKESGVARQGLYRTLDELLAKGIIVKILDSPTQYEALPLKEGLAILLKHKYDEIHKIEKETDILLQKLTGKTPTALWGKEGNFICLSSKEASLVMFKKALDRAQKSYCIVMPGEAFLNAFCIFEKWAESLAKKSKMGVKIRLLTTKPKKECRNLPKMVLTLEKKAVEVRYIKSDPIRPFAIFDNKETFIPTEQKRLPSTSGCLYTDNSCISLIIQDYFEKLWNEAIKQEEREPVTFRRICLN